MQRGWYALRHCSTLVIRFAAIELWLTLVVPPLDVHLVRVRVRDRGRQLAQCGAQEAGKGATRSIGRGRVCSRKSLFSLRKSSAVFSRNRKGQNNVGVAYKNGTGAVGQRQAAG